MEQDQLEIRLKAALTDSVNQFNTLTNAAVNFDKSLTSIITKTDKLGNVTKISATTKFLDNEVAKIKTTMNGSGEVISRTFSTIEKNGKNLKGTLSTIFDINKLYLYWNLTKRLRDGVKALVTSSIDYIETENKFNMSMGEGKPQAVRSVNQLSEAIGTAKAELMDYQATYKNILSALGSFTDQQSEEISESLTKMALDYSSLFNVDRSKAMNKFQSALVGSIRPIRSDSGYDVSDTTIGAKAQELGIDRSVGQLNQMEKRLLRIIVLMDQLKATGAFGDLARTIEQPANQLQVLKAQIQEVGIWIGNVFMGTIGKVLPYINAFVMVIKELVKMFAIFVGYKGDTSNLSDAFEVAGVNAGGIASGLDKADKNAKKLKRTLMGFDVLNVITTPTDSKSAGSSGGIGSVDPAILNSLGKYNSMMEKVRMKATDIRDKIMDWLGFTKIIDPLTGEISWKLKDGLTNFEKILEIAKAIGIAIGTWKVSKTIANLFSTMFGTSKKKTLGIAFGVTLSLTGFYLFHKGIEHLMNGDWDLFTIAETVFGGATSAFGIVTILNHLKIGKSMSFPQKLKIGVGIVLAVEMGIELAKTWAKQLEGAGNIGTFLQGAGKSSILGLIIAGITGQPLAGLALAAGTIAISMGLAIGANIKVIQENWDEASKEISTWIENKKTEVNNFFDENIAPWFTKEKWQTLMTQAGGGIKSKWNEFIAWWKTTGLYKWWNEDVAPWFTKEKWQGIVDNAKLGMNNKFNEWRENFNIIDKWWNEKIAPWFTWEKWQGIVDNAKLGMNNKFNEWRENFNIIDKWWNEKIAPWFTWEKWKQLGQTALDSLRTAFENFRLPDIKMPHFEIDYETQGLIAKAFQTMGLAGKPTLRVNWYAEGGLPDIGEMFIAREAGPELVGRIGNSNAVVNNQQIVQAVSQGVAQAVSSVIGQGFGNITVPVYLGTNKIQEEMYDLNSRENNIRGR